MLLPNSAFFHEVRHLLALGAPIFLGQLAQAGMGAVDAMMAGNYHASDLAAIAIGQSLWLPLLVFFVGVFNATTTTVAHQSGANDIPAIKTTTQQSLWLALAVAPLGLVLVFNADTVCSWLGVEVDVAAITVDYLYYLSFCLPALSCFLVLRAFCEGQGKTQMIMMINIIAFICNIPLNYLFIYGAFGLPALGGAGCGLATCVVIWIQLLFVVIAINYNSQLQKMAIFKQWRKPCRQQILSLLRLGLPIGVTVLAEVALFSCVALIIAPLGSLVLAANQIAMSVTSLLFMLPLSIGMAVNIRVGNHLGTHGYKAARFSSLVGVAVAIVLALVSMLVIIIGRDHIAAIYTSDTAVAVMASALLFYAAIYQLPDALQVCVINALRGYRDTRVPLFIVLFAYWLVSVPLGWCLTMGGAGLTALGAKGMWIGLVCGLSFAAVMLSWRFRCLLQRFAHL